MKPNMLMPQVIPAGLQANMTPWPIDSLRPTTNEANGARALHWLRTEFHFLFISTPKMLSTQIHEVARRKERKEMASVYLWRKVGK